MRRRAAPCVVRPAKRHAPGFFIVVGVVLAGRMVAGHEFWLTVTSTRLSPGQTVPFVIGFGERLQDPAAGADLGAIEIQLTDGAGKQLRLATPLQDARVALMKGAIQVPVEPGFYTIAAALHGKAIHYAAADFQAYLAREQLTSALTFRKALGEETRDAQEIVSMFAKCIVRVGSPPNQDLPMLRTRIELQPVSDPTALRAGDTLHVRLFFNNGPQARRAHRRIRISRRCRTGACEGPYKRDPARRILFFPEPESGSFGLFK